MISRKEFFYREENLWKPPNKRDFNFDVTFPVFINAIPYELSEIPSQKQIMPETRRDKTSLQMIRRSKSEEFAIMKNSPSFNSKQFSARHSPLELRQEFSAERVKKSITINTKRTLALKVVKNKKIQSRKISLDWTTYSTSQSIVDREFEKRSQYLRVKYFTKWKLSVKKKISARESKETNCQNLEEDRVNGKYKSPTRRKIREREKIDKLRWEHHRKKIVEQANKIKELELTRLKLEEQLFARDVQEMLTVNQNKSPKSDSRASVISTQEVSEEPDKKDPNRLKTGWEWVTRMEIRARERQQRRDGIRERRQMLEMEKTEKARLEEEKRRENEDKQKKQRALEIRREIKQRIELKKKQEEERIRLNNLNEMVREFYKRNLLKSSFASWVLFLDQTRTSIAHAENYYNSKLLLNSLVALNLFRKVELKIKKDRADEVYENILLNKSFSAFKKVYLDQQSKAKKAEESNKFRLIRSYFSCWFSFHIHEKCEYLNKNELATQHYERSLVRQYFQRWSQLPLIHFREREKEQRFRTWYTKVQELLPDFHPSNVIEC